MPVEVYGHSSAGGGQQVLTSLSVPPATQLGALLILVATAGSQSGAATLDVPDSRFTLLRELDAPNATDGTHWSEGGVWYGYASTLDPISLNIVPGNSATDVAKVACIALKARVNTGRIATVTATSNSYTLPGLPGINDGAVVAIVGRMGLGDASWTGGGIYSMEYQGDSYCEVALGYTATRGTIDPQAASWDDLGTGGTIRTNSCVIALRAVPLAAPPCRNIKRGDVLDLGGARNYPPSKMTNTSSRGVGAY